MGVKVSVKGFRTTGAGVDLACSDHRVTVAVTAGIDRALANYALGHPSVPKEGHPARKEPAGRVA